MLLEIIAHHARWSPEKIAIVSKEGQAAKYAQVHAAVTGLAASLLTDFPEIQSTGPVAIAIADHRSLFLLALALEYLGVTSLPFVTPADQDIREAVRQCPLLLSDHYLVDHPGRQFTLAKEWLEHAFRFTPTSPPPPVRWQPRQIVTIIVTSGSMGIAKSVRLSYQARNAREANRAWRYGFSPNTRYLVGLPTSVSTIAVACRAALRSGGTLIFSNPALGERLFDGVTHTTLMPAHIRAYLDELPSSFVRQEKLRLISIGAPLSGELRERVTRVLNADVDNNYGSNEGGSCGRVDAENVGHIVPGSYLKVVDENKNEVPPGRTGTVWVRNEELAEGYTDARMTNNSFFNGWFDTGDIGVMTGPRTFKLLGRADAMMNLGGMKVSPETFEAVLIPLGISRDLAVTSVTHSDGIEQIYVCLEQPLLPDIELLNRLQPIFGPNVGHVHVIFVDKIPRSLAKKIQRSKVHELAVSHKPKPSI